MAKWFKRVMNRLLAKIDSAKIAVITGLSINQVHSIEPESANITESSQLARDWQSLSERSLQEVWLNEEEDQAWKDL